jgi:type VI protein secretion system component VasK
MEMDETLLSLIKSNQYIRLYMLRGLYFHEKRQGQDISISTSRMEHSISHKSNSISSDSSYLKIQLAEPDRHL